MKSKRSNENKSENTCQGQGAFLRKPTKKKKKKRRKYKKHNFDFCFMYSGEVMAFDPEADCERFCWPFHN